jgi:Tol biopolymer transport system component
VFETLGKLWTKPVAGGTATRLTRGADEFELFPSWSRDGRQIVFVGWTDAGLGQIRTIAAGGGSPRTVTTAAGALFEQLEFVRASRPTHARSCSNRARAAG